MPNATCPIAACAQVLTGDSPEILAALLNIHATTHTGNTASFKKPDRPEFNFEMSETEWAERKFFWEKYKKDANITDKPDKICSELIECCVKSLP